MSRTLYTRTVVHWGHGASLYNSAKTRETGPHQDTSNVVASRAETRGGDLVAARNFSS
jgi:hypothetical protein